MPSGSDRADLAGGDPLPLQRQRGLQDRDVAAIEHHTEELDAQGDQGSGEAEPVLFCAGAPVEGAFLSRGMLTAIPNGVGEAIRPAAATELELSDPRLNRRPVHRFAIQTIPVIA